MGTNSEYRLLVNVGDAPDASKALNWNTGYNGLVIIKLPEMLPDFKQVLTHQMARIAVRTRLATYKSLPEWYQDGVAAYVAGDITQDQRFAATTMAATGTWMSLDEVERLYKNMTIYNYDDQKNSDARTEAATLVDKSTCMAPWVLIAIIDDYTESGNLEQAFINQTTFTSDTLNTVYKNLIAGNSNSSRASPPEGRSRGTCGTLTASLRPGKPSRYQERTELRM